MAKWNSLPQPPVAPIVDETSFFIYLACFLGILLLKEAVVFWIQSFKTDKIDLVLKNSETILKSIDKSEDLNSSLVTKLQEISINQVMILKLIEKISDRLDRK